MCGWTEAAARAQRPGSGTAQPWALRVTLPSPAAAARQQRQRSLQPAVPAGRGAPPAFAGWISPGKGCVAHGLPAHPAWQQEQQQACAEGAPSPSKFPPIHYSPLAQPATSPGTWQHHAMVVLAWQRWSAGVCCPARVRREPLVIVSLPRHLSQPLLLTPCRSVRYAARHASVDQRLAREPPHPGTPLTLRSPSSLGGGPCCSHISSCKPGSCQLNGRA